MNPKVKRLVTAAILLGGGFLYVRGRKANGPEVEYETEAVVRSELLDKVSAAGLIKPFTEVTIKPNVGGEILELNVELGDFIRKGHIIARIDRTDSQTAVDQAVAEVRASAAQIKQAEYGEELWDKQVASRIAGAEQAVAAAKARRAQARARMSEAEATAAAEPDIFAARKAEASAALDQADQAVEVARQRKRGLEATTAQNYAAATNGAAQAKARMDTASSDYRRQRGLLAQGFARVDEAERAFNEWENAKASYQKARERAGTIDKQNSALLAGASVAIVEAEARRREVKSSLDRVEQGRVLIEVRRRAYDAAKASYDRTQADIDRSQANLETARADRIRVGMAGQEIIAAKAGRTRAVARRTQALQNLEYTLVRAPRDGYVIAKYVEAGTIVTPGRRSRRSQSGSSSSTTVRQTPRQKQAALRRQAAERDRGNQRRQQPRQRSGRRQRPDNSSIIAIGDMSTIQIYSLVDETDIAHVYVKQKVTVTVDAYRWRKLQGVVERIEPVALEEDNVTTVPVTVNLVNIPKDMLPLLRPAMNVTCDFIITNKKDVLLVANSAIQEVELGLFSVRVMEDGVAVSVPVEIGVADAEMTEILSGVIEGMEVVTKVIESEDEESTSPFGNPFGVFGNRRRDENRTRGGGPPGMGGGRRAVGLPPGSQRVGPGRPFKTGGAPASGAFQRQGGR